MITTPATIVALQAEWAGVEKMLGRMKLLVTATFAGGAFTGPALANVVYNLPVLLAFDVLGQVLVASRDEGAFSCKGDKLGPLMDNAKVPLSWLDWQKLRDGVRYRNEIAHDGKLFEAKECNEMISQIRNQLAAWNIL